MSDIPFVCISKWQNVQKIPPSYTGLVKYINTGELEYPVLTIDCEKGTVRTEPDYEIQLPSRQFGLFYFFLLFTLNGSQYCYWQDFCDELQEYIVRNDRFEDETYWGGKFCKGYIKENATTGAREFTADYETVRKRMSEVRVALRGLFRFTQLADTLIPDRDFQVGYPKTKIKLISNPDKELSL